MRVFPSPGLLVRDPVKKDFVPAEGREVDDNDLYWLRRLADGDATTEAPKVARSLPAAPVRSADE